MKSMVNISKVIAIIDTEIEGSGIDYLTPPQANKILADQGVLKDSKHRPGLPLRNLLRDGLLPHAYQVEGRWRIPHSTKTSEEEIPATPIEAIKIKQTKENRLKATLVLGFAIFVIVIGLISESNQKTPVQSSVIINSTPPIIYDTTTIKGYVKNIYSINGNIASEGFVKNKLKDGKWLFYSENGRLIEKIVFKNGIQDGEFEKYYADGITIDEKGKYENNMLVGVWEHYFDNGLVSERYHYLNGLRDGKYEEYGIQNAVSSKPFLNTIGYYKNDKKEGEWKYYDYYFDIATKTVSNKLLLTDVVNYSNDEGNGKSIQYDKQFGFKLIETNYINGIENGIRKSYCPVGRDAGKLWIVEEYNNGELVNKLPYQCGCPN